VRVEIVLNEDDLFGLCKMHIGEFFQNLRIIDGRPAIRDLDAPPALERGEQHEQIGGSVAAVFAIMARGRARLHGDRRPGFGDALL